MTYTINHMNQSVVSQIYELAKEQGMPISSPGLIMFSLNTKIPNKFDSHKAFIYDKPTFTEIHLLTHEQLEEINKILYKDDNNIKKKDISIIDFSKMPRSDSEQLISCSPVNSPVAETNRFSPLRDLIEDETEISEDNKNIPEASNDKNESDKNKSNQKHINKSHVKKVKLQKTI